MPAAKNGGKKRGRKPKNSIVKKNTEIVKPAPKKRGRKPKGGKIIKNTKDPLKNEVLNKSNIILHLKCSTADLETNSDTKFEPEYLNLQKTTNIKYNEINSETKTSCQKKGIWDKLSTLKKKMHFNDVSDKRSNCFWCTCTFDNPPIYIPKQERNGQIEVYGCFCSPECAVAYLKREPIDTSTLWERYSLLNNVYSDIFNYEKK